MKPSGNAILTALVALAVLAVGFVVGIVAFGKGADNNSTPLVVTVLGFISTIIVSLVALLKADATRQELKNGLIPEKIKEAAEQGTIVVPRNGVRTRRTDNVRTDRGATTDQE